MPRIAVVGSYATGLTMKVERLPGTGETVLGTGYRVDYGGKGSNQAVGCARLGAQVSFIAKIGTDSFGEMAMKLYRDECIDVAHVRRTVDIPTGVGFILVESGSGRNCIVLDPGANELLTDNDVNQCEAVIASAAVVMTQLEIPVAAAEAALVQGRSGGAITILNPAPVRLLPGSVLQAADILTPNEVEAKVLTGRGPDAASEPGEVARDLIRLGVKQVVMTLGENGALVVTSSSSRHIPAPHMSAVDTTGAGDAFNAGLATALASGAGLEDAVRFAVVAGSLAVTREGVIPSLPNRQEVSEFCRQRKLILPDWFLANSQNGSDSMLRGGGVR
jgi:ribokinase